MYAFDKTLSDTDSIYCRTVTNSHQSSIFITQTNGDVANSLFGNNYASNDDVVLVVSKVNLIFNILAHYLGGTSYFKRSSSSKWDLSKQWLLERKTKLDSVFTANQARFHAQINKETTRTYLKGLAAMVPEGGHETLDLRQYLFSGDTIRLSQIAEGTIQLEVLGCGDGVTPEIDLRKEFIDWLTNDYRKPDGNALKKSARDSYVRAIDETTEPDPSGAPANSHGAVTWWNIYQHLHGTPAPKKIFHIDNVTEYNDIFGSLKLAVTVGGDAPPNVLSQSFSDIFQWKEGQSGGCFISNALLRYEEFLKWRESKKTHESESPKPDIIDFAVAEFAKHRMDADWVALLKRDGYEGIRARYDAMNPETLRNMDDAAFDKWIDDELWAASTFFCGQNLKKLTHEQKHACAEFIAATKQNFKLSHKYFGKAPEIPYGFGPVAATELLMKFHPLDYIGYSKLMLQGLKTLGLVENDTLPTTVSAAEYHHMMGHAAMLLERLSDAKVPRSFDDTEAQEPDYLTVNEFIWWCKHYRDDILKKYWERYMKTPIKNVPQNPIGDFSDFIEKLEKDVKDAGLVYAPGLMRRFVCAQLAKPFVVLTGLSGSGKTKLAQAFTDWIAVENTAKIVPVGADWTNSEKILGYPNALDPDKYVLPDTGVLKLMLDARDNPGLPFFLILDEMNLSHVERYFADFLSTMESEGTIKLYDGKARFADDGTPVPSVLEWPTNLFVIGTMNVDETTYMFSPKVLDRAQVIEFRVAKKAIADFLDAPKAPDMKSLKEKGAAYAAAFLKLAEKRKEKKPAAPELATVKTALVGMFEELEKLGSEFAFRSAGEIVNFIAYYLEASGYGKIPVGTDKQKCLTSAIDAAVVQKLLPKLHGSLNRLGPVLDALIEKSIKKIQPANDPDAEPEIQKIYELTYEKLLRMKERVEKNGFTSFAEA